MLILRYSIEETSTYRLIIESIQSHYFRSQLCQLVCVSGLRILLLSRDSRGIHELRKGKIIVSFFRAFDIFQQVSHCKFFIELLLYHQGYLWSHLRKNWSRLQALYKRIMLNFTLYYTIYVCETFLSRLRKKIFSVKISRLLICIHVIGNKKKVLWSF